MFRENCLPAYAPETDLQTNAPTKIHAWLVEAVTMYRKPLIAFLFVGMQLALQPDTATGQSIDPAQLFKSKCMSCHSQELGQFVQRKLKIENGMLVAFKSKRPVGEMLRMHFGVQLSSEEMTRLIEELSKELHD